MPPTPDGLLLSAVLDVRHRHLRLIHGLRQLGRDPDPAIRALVEAAEVTARQRLQEFEQELQEHLALTPTGGPVSEPPWLAEAWTALARRQLHQLALTQRELLRYIPMPTAVPADIGFFLARGLGLSPTRHSHRRRFGLSLSSYSTWESEAFGEPGIRVAALPIPFGERMTPLRWPCLLHELGHHILPPASGENEGLHVDTENLIADLLGPDPQVRSRNEYREVLADRVAERYCGPAYAFALLRETVLANEATDPDSPSVRCRLLVLDAGPHIEELLPSTWREALRSGNDDADLSAARAKALERLPHRTDLAPRGEIVEAIHALMGIGEPAGSVRPPSAPLPDLDGMTADDVNDAFIAAADLVVRDSELLCAAWTVEVCRSGQSYFDDLADSFLKGNTLDVQSLDEAVAARARADTGVSRGLQSIGVHQWLIDNDEHTAEATAKLYNGSFATSSLLLHLGVSATTQDAGEERGPTTEELAVPTPSTDDESSPLADQHLLRRLNAVGPERLVIRPLIDPMQLGGTTVDLRLGTEWEVLRTTRFQALDPSDSKASVDALLNTSVEQFRLTSGQTQGLVLHPGELILALTLEYLRIPADLWGNVEGRSTWARLGLQVHATAGMIDAGFNGYLTLELQNTGRLPMVLTPGLRVAQVAFFPVKGIARSYRSKPGAAYSDQTTARTAFVQQHEHTALRRYLHGERLAEQRELGGSEAGQVD